MKLIPFALSPEPARRTRRTLSLALPLALAYGLVACGGGGTAEPDSALGADAPSAASARRLIASPAATSAQLPTAAQRIGAATATAQSATNACTAVQPFYWEVGDKLQRQAAGSVQASTGPVYTAHSVMSIASSSKWLYAAYVVERRQAVLDDTDIKFLTFQSGYTNFSTCLPGQTVESCLAFQDNGEHSDTTDGRFDYSGGHMQKHAAMLGLGGLDSAGLSAEVQTQLGRDVFLRYSQPQPAGGVVSTPNAYAAFLRKLLAGQLRMGSVLGTHAVCTNPTTCPAGQAVYTPVPTSESWHYAIGHWVEDDPVVGDGAFSSAGAFGFYPWIDASKHWYGVVARTAQAGSGYASAQCGRLIRKAWVEGQAY